MLVGKFNDLEKLAREEKRQSHPEPEIVVEATRLSERMRQTAKAKKRVDKDFDLIVKEAMISVNK
jgi:hypothetical protein